MKKQGVMWLSIIGKMRASMPTEITKASSRVCGVQSMPRITSTLLGHWSFQFAQNTAEVKNCANASPNFDKMQWKASSRERTITAFTSRWRATSILKNPPFSQTFITFSPIRWIICTSAILCGILSEGKTMFKGIMISSTETGSVGFLLSTKFA